MGEPLNRTGRGLSPLGTELALLRTGLSPLGAGLALLGTESLPARGRALPAWERRVPARDGDSYRWGEWHTRWFAACPFCPLRRRGQQRAEGLLHGSPQRRSRRLEGDADRVQMPPADLGTGPQDLGITVEAERQAETAGLAQPGSPPGA